MTAAYSEAELDAIRAHAESEWPAECCGVVTHEGVVRGRNLRRSGVAFEIDAATLTRTRGEVRGVYHSHCDAPAVMSGADLEAARWWPAVDHVVVRVDGGVAGTVRCHGADGTVRWTSA